MTRKEMRKALVTMVKDDSAEVGTVRGSLIFFSKRLWLSNVGFIFVKSNMTLIHKGWDYDGENLAMAPTI